MVKYEIYTKVDGLGQFIKKGKGYLRYSTDDYDDAMINRELLKDMWPTLYDTSNNTIYTPWKTKMDPSASDWSDAPHQLYKMRMVTLPKYLSDIARHLGYGNASRGVRTALIAYDDQPEPIVTGKHRQVAISIDSSQADSLRCIGDGNLSRGVRWVLGVMPTEDMVIQGKYLIVDNKLVDSSTKEPVETLVHDGDLCLDNASVNLPESVTVSSNLSLRNLNHNGILPDTLCVGGNLDLSNTVITKWPTSLWVNGDIYLWENTPLTTNQRQLLSNLTD